MRKSKAKFHDAERKRRDERFEKARRELGATEALLNILEPIEDDERRKRVLAAAAIMVDAVDMSAVDYVLMRIHTE